MCRVICRLHVIFHLHTKSIELNGITEHHLAGAFASQIPFRPVDALYQSNIHLFLLLSQTPYCIIPPPPPSLNESYTEIRFNRVPELPIQFAPFSDGAPKSGTQTVNPKPLFVWL